MMQVSQKWIDTSWHFKIVFKNDIVLTHVVEQVFHHKDNDPPHQN